MRKGETGKERGRGKGEAGREEMREKTSIKSERK